MFYKARYYRQPSFREGMRSIAPVTPGIAAWGLMTGVAMVQMGLSPTLSLVVTIFVFAGSAQLATVPLLITGAPLWVVFFTAFCVNLRFVVFSAHMQPFLRHLPLLERLQIGYLTGDFPYVLFTQKYKTPGTTIEQLEEQQAFHMGTTSLMYCSWQISSIVGIAFSSIIPLSLGLSFAGVLALVGVLASMMTSTLRILSLGVSGLAAIMAYSMPLHLNVVVAIVCSVVVCLLFEHFIPDSHSKKENV